MSTIIMAACWPLQGMSPSQKAVLISLADKANDDEREHYHFQRCKHNRERKRTRFLSLCKERHILFRY